MLIGLSDDTVTGYSARLKYWRLRNHHGYIDVRLARNISRRRISMNARLRRFRRIGRTPVPSRIIAIVKELFEIMVQYAFAGHPEPRRFRHKIRSADGTRWTICISRPSNWRLFLYSTNNAGGRELAGYILQRLFFSLVV